MTHEDSWNGDLKTTALNSPKRDHRFFYFKMHMEYLARIEHGKGEKASTFKI